jgi:hypothetical protein
VVSSVVFIIFLSHKMRNRQLKYPVTHTAIHKLVTCAFLWLCFSLFTYSAAMSEIEVPLLPADENEAIRMLEEETLDSSVWRKIEAYYIMPLSVPQGELHILQDQFPELPADLPVAPDELSRYFPWDDGAVKMFFADFPELVSFQPILSFETGPAVPFPGRAALFFSRRGANDSGRQYALFSLGDPARLSAGGRVDFTDAYGRWFRRSLSAAPLSGVRVVCGNFSPKRRTPFFSGYFPPAGDADTAVADNWLYGGARTWNGVSATVSLAHDKKALYAVDAEAFCHAGRFEQIGQLNGSIVLSRRLTGFGGISFLRTIDPDKPAGNSGFLHTGLEFYPAPQWRCEFQSSVNGENPAAVPWQASVSHVAGGSAFKGTFTGLPEKYASPRAETVRLLRTRAKNDSVSGYLLSSDLLFRQKLNRFLTFAPRLNCLLSGGRPCYLFSGFEFSGRAWCGYRCGYSWSPLFHDTGLAYRQQVTAECSLPVSKKAGIELYGNRLSGQGYWSSRLRVFVPVKANGALEVTPLFMIYANRFGTQEKTAGIRQRLLLYKKTFSDITVEQELPFSSWETIRVRGKMSFFL